MPEKAVLPQTRLIRYAPKTQHTWHILSEMVAFKDPLTLDIACPSSLGSSFVIEIETHVRRIELEQICQTTKIRQVYYCSSLYICHTKAVTTLVEYGTWCLYEDTNFYSVLIVRSAFWLKLKSSHFRKSCEETFICVPRLCRIAWKYFQLQQNCLYDVQG